MAQIPVGGPTSDLPVGLVGQPIRTVPDRENKVARADAAGVLQQSSVVTVGGAGNSATYSLRILATDNGSAFDTTYTVTTDGSGTIAELRDLLYDAMIADAALGVVVSGIALTTGVLTLSWAAGRSGTVTFPLNPSTHLTVATTAAGFAQYTYGRFVEVVELVGQPANLVGEGIQPITAIDGGKLALTIETNTSSQTSTTVVLHSYSDGRLPVTETLAVSSSSTAALTAAAIVAAAESLWTEADVEITIAAEEVTITLPPGEELAVISVTNTSTLDISVATTAAVVVPKLALVIDAHNVDPIPSRTGITTVTGPLPGRPVLTADPTGHSTEWAIVAPGTSLASTRVYADASGIYDAPAIGRLPVAAARFTRIYGAIAGLEY